MARGKARAGEDAMEYTVGPILDPRRKAAITEDVLRAA